MDFSTSTAGHQPDVGANLRPSRDQFDRTADCFFQPSMQFLPWESQRATQPDETPLLREKRRHVWQFQKPCKSGVVAEGRVEIKREVGAIEREIPLKGELELAVSGTRDRLNPAPEETVVDHKEIDPSGDCHPQRRFASVDGCADLADLPAVFDLQSIERVAPIGDLLFVEEGVEVTGDFVEGGEGHRRFVKEGWRVGGIVGRRESLWQGSAVLRKCPLALSVASPYDPGFFLMSIWNHANQQLRELISYEPGKPVEDVARELGVSPSEIIKLASNENPLGPSPKALVAMRESLERSHFYPDGGGYYLREAIASKFGLTREHVILGNGSNEIIEFLGKGFLQVGDEIVTARHAFAVYSLMAQLFGASTITVDDPHFTHDLDAMAAAITPKTKQIFVANPNNPTGTIVSQADLDRFVAAVPEHVIIVLDEAYYEFLENPPDTLKYIREGRRNVILLRTFSKIQGLANLRIGYGIGHPELIDILQKTRQPFNANGIAQAGALAGLLDEEHQEATRKLTDEGREYLQRSFASLGLKFVPSYGNFVLVKVGDGKKLFGALLKRGIIVRDMTSYHLPEWIRVSVGTMEQNTRFIRELNLLMGGK